MNAQTLNRAVHYHRKRTAGFRDRLQRRRYMILQQLIESGPLSTGELAIQLSMTIHAVRKAALSLTVSGLVARDESNGERMTVTDTGMRVWKEADREKQRWLERQSALGTALELEPSVSARVR
ncbi:hypothetical protein KP806_00685 [Paenibacillus sp. N4]|uniref:hypothetical protein n=1 Tax=Paenibacillus vietnamensis TaxID=2590547 RepID=UPI001CD11E4A|nr:hypothetical protein [Paenibacillus vietnamensis]MCA0753550.1 hypothetical protein [Paenibacillus vietnamensis]